MKRKKSIQHRLSTLAEALRYIVEFGDYEHVGDEGEDLDHEPECWCSRCVAVRALNETGLRK